MIVNNMFAVRKLQVAILARSSREICEQSSILMRVVVHFYFTHYCLRLYNNVYAYFESIHEIQLGIYNLYINTGRNGLSEHAILFYC